MTLTMGQQLAVRRLKSADPCATAADIAMKIHACKRDVEAAMQKPQAHAPVFRGKKAKALPAPKAPHHLPGGDRKAAGIPEPERMHIPADVLADRERRLAMEPRPFGDPVPGRSALDKRQGA